MPTYRCRKCSKYTEWLDVPPCGEDCDAEFQSVATIHYHEHSRNTITDILCNGTSPMNLEIKTTTILSAATCPRCIEKYEELEKLAASDKMPEDKPSADNPQL